MFFLSKLGEWLPDACDNSLLFMRCSDSSFVVGFIIFFSHEHHVFASARLAFGIKAQFHVNLFLHVDNLLLQCCLDNTVALVNLNLWAQCHAREVIFCTN